MKIISAVEAMGALAHESRLNLFRRLVKAGTDGMAVGQLVDATGLNLTTVSAQLLILQNNNLVRKDRHGRSIIYSANYTTMQSLITFLVKDCCRGNADVQSASKKPGKKGTCS